MWTDPVWTDPVWTEVYMYAAMAMSLGAVLVMLIATGAMVSGQQSMTVYISIVHGIIITGNSDHIHIPLRTL